MLNKEPSRVSGQTAFIFLIFRMIMVNGDGHKWRLDNTDLLQLGENWQNIQSQSSISNGENCSVRWHICNRILLGESERLMFAPCCRWNRTEGKGLARRRRYRVERGWDELVNRLPSALLVAVAAVLRAQWGSGQLAHCLLKLITAFYILTNTDYCSRSGRPAECALYGAPH